mgnify:CR=1 FL=1
MVLDRSAKWSQLVVNARQACIGTTPGNATIHTTTQNKVDTRHGIDRLLRQQQLQLQPTNETISDDLQLRHTAQQCRAKSNRNLYSENASGTILIRAVLIALPYPSLETPNNNYEIEEIQAVVQVLELSMKMHDLGLPKAHFDRCEVPGQTLEKLRSIFDYFFYSRLGMISMRMMSSCSTLSCRG